MAEVATASIGLWVPVVGQFDERGGFLRGAPTVAWSRKEDQREATLLAFGAPHFAHTQLVAEKVQALVDVGDADHRVKVAHWVPLLGRSCFACRF